MARYVKITSSDHQHLTLDLEVAVTLHTARYMILCVLFTVEQDDYGWKIIHTDVFRFPPYKSWLCAILGLYT